MAAKKQKRAKAKRALGRPSLYTPEIEEALLDWLYEGKSLLSFCRQPGMPKRRTIDDWGEVEKEPAPGFSARFARARAASADVLTEVAQDIADDSSHDYVEIENKDGSTRRVFDSEHVQRSKLRVDQLNRRAACYDPRRYGTKVALGGDASAPPIKVESSGGPPLPSSVDLLDQMRTATRIIEEVVGAKKPDDAG